MIDKYKNFTLLQDCGECEHTEIARESVQREFYTPHETNKP